MSNGQEPGPGPGQGSDQGSEHASGHGHGGHRDPRGFAVLLQPVVLITLIVVGAVVALMSMATLGLDKGVLLGMARQDYARGVITYLFAVVTIGTSVVIILSALLGKDDAHAKEQFQRGKEILSLLLGVFGTIVGYYFGSTPSTAAHDFRLSAVHIGAPTANAPDQVAIEAVASGGTPPYVYGVGIGKTPIEADKPVRDDGWIADQLKAQSPGPVQVRIVVQDATGNILQKTVLIAR